MEPLPSSQEEVILPHRVGKRFQNPHQQNVHRRLLHHLLWWWGHYDDPQPLAAPPEGFVYPNPDLPLVTGKPKVCWLGHSTFLIDLYGVQILTDPVWGERCSPFAFCGPRRHASPPLPLEYLPPLNAVLISHNHYDHLDAKAVKELARRQPDLVWFLPEGLGKWFSKRGIDRYIECDWWEGGTLPMLPEVEFTAVPAQHYSGRSLFDHNSTLWAGWVVAYQKEGQPLSTFYFAGDTGYNEVDFKAIGRGWGWIDLSLIPVGVYRPRRFMKPVHVNPEEAVQIHLDVGSRMTVGSHWGTYPLSTEPLSRPPYDLYLALEEKGLSPETFRLLKPGQAVNW